MTKLHDVEVDDYLYRSVTIVPEALQEEYVRLPADLAYWNKRYADAYEEVAKAKVGLSRLEALLRIHHRNELVADNAKVTESMVDAAVSGDERFQRAQDDLIAADVRRVTMQGNVDAVRAKREMIVSVGAQIRAEMAGDPTIRKQHEAARGYPSGGLAVAPPLKPNQPIKKRT